MRQDDLASCLLMASSSLLSSDQAQASLENQDSTAASGTQHSQALSGYADDILARRSRMLHLQLGSTVRHRVNATLSLLVAIARRGSAATAHLVRSLDMSSDAFSKLSHPPK